MYRIIYTSEATHEMSFSELEQIVDKSRANNAPHGITGMLTYWNGMFAQCLEGERRVLEATYARICRDRRHRDCHVLMEGDVPRRHFRGWSMHLVSMNEATEAVAGVRRKFDVARRAADMMRDPLVVMSLLYDLGEASRGAAEHAA